MVELTKILNFSSKIAWDEDPWAYETVKMYWKRPTRAPFKPLTEMRVKPSVVRVDVSKTTTIHQIPEHPRKQVEVLQKASISPPAPHGDTLS